MQPPPDPRLAQIFSCLQRGQTTQAAELSERLLHEQPHNPQARLAGALVDRLSGRMDRALGTLESLAAELPQNPMIRAELASTRVMAGRVAEALPVLREIVAAQPANPFGHYWLGQAHLRAFEGPEAVRCLERVRQLNPADTNVLSPLASAYIAAGKPAAAEQTARALLDAQPRNPEALYALAAALEQQSRVAEAGEVFERVLQIAPDSPRALAGRARVLQTLGRNDEARALLEPLLRAPRAQPVVLSTYAGLCSTAEHRRACIAAAEPALADPAVPAQERAGLCFAIARMLDAEREHDRAFEMFKRANDLYPRLYKPVQRQSYTEDIIRTFSAAAIATMPRAKADSTRPIFILGMPRSGTTLVEQIVGSHPDVHAGGELQEMRSIWRDLIGSTGVGVVAGLAGLTQRDIDAAAQRYLDRLATISPDAPHVTDKMPHNFEQLGLINLILPKARVIHCVRNPIDTCVSCFVTQFSTAHSYSNDLSHLGHAYGEYHRLMNHWRTALDLPMLDVVYEDLVADIEAGARRIVEFLGLPWHDACLRFYEADRAVTTASVDQVRRPIYSSSVARWRRYERHLGPLLAALRQCGVPLDDPPGAG